MSFEKRLKNFLQGRKRTLLGIGPMSKNIVDATIELAKEHDIPLMLIASRRQIEAEKFGGGYANNWTTESFAEYVKKNDSRGNIILARDHGGPWQNYPEVENKMKLGEAMQSAKESYRVDIESGFQVIHLDSSIDIHKKISPKETLERLFDIYKYCHSVSQNLGKEILFEIGTDEQQEEQQNIEELEELLYATDEFRKANNLPAPFFVVVQTGTKVKETKNIGVIENPFRERGIIPPEVQISQLVDVCNKYGVHLKEHNADYLSEDVLSWHPRLGIHSVNVAPEFGVFETKHILKICDELGLKRESDKFLEIAYNSGKWDKWLLDGTEATDYDKAIIAGHYVFAKPEFLEIKNKIKEKCGDCGIDLNKSTKEGIKFTIRRYLYHFNLI